MNCAVRSPAPGIEGACAHRYDVVAMDAYSNVDVEPKQVSYLNDFDRLCATKDYNVTFERAARVAYADRAHIFISGCLRARSPLRR